MDDRTTTTVRRGALLLSAALAAAIGRPAEEPPLRSFLRNVIKLDDAQLAAVDKGEVVTKLLPTPEK